jgi:hypothetical protein
MIATINLVLSWVLVLLFLITQSMNKKWSSLISFIVTFTILYFSRCDLSISLVLAFLVAFLANLFLAKTNHHESFENPEEESKPEEEDKDSFIDVGKTFLQAYKSLTPGQIETMTTDTKELIDTQKNLLETIKTLAPIVTEGKKMLDTFKDYFGDHTSVIQQLKSASDIIKPK